MPLRQHDPLRIAFVSAEFAPIAKVGGLGAASAGLVAALRSAGVDVDVIIPDYNHHPLDHEVVEQLNMPAWAGRAHARHGVDAVAGPVTLINVGGIERDHPYVDTATGEGWGDNDHRFFAFAAAAAELISLDPPDVVHVNDWHASAVTAFIDPTLPSVLTIHNIAHQGHADRSWLDKFGPRAGAFDRDGALNPLAGAIQLADAVVAVSHSYAREILEPEMGCGLSDLLRSKGDSLVGIRNGIVRDTWDPVDSRHLAAPFSELDLSGKAACRQALLRTAGLENSRGPVIGMVSRLDHQKGIDIALALAPMLNALPARLVLHGSGSPSLAEHARQIAAHHSSSLTVLDGYSDATAQMIMAGSDLVLIPSRFEPCGLTQMQAMSYGAIPVVTNVGGLRDTVIDLDHDKRRGTGFVAGRSDTASVTETLCRAVRGWQNPDRRARAQRRGMTSDWSWDRPAANHIEIYRDLTSRSRSRARHHQKDIA